MTMACDHVTREECDLIVHNATIYSVNEHFEIFQAMAIKDGRVLELGAERQILNKYKAEKKYDAATKIIFPGFIDAHCHFMGYGLNKQKLDLAGTSSWQEVLELVEAYGRSNPNKPWIIGRGWDQNDWKVNEYPTNEDLNELFPDRPVLLQRIDGHAAIANQAALDHAGLNEETYVDGGVLEVKDGKPTGLLIDNAVDVYQQFFSDAPDEDKKEALLKAQSDLFKVGVTSVHDAGLDVGSIKIIRSLQDSSDLLMRIYAMVADNEENYPYLEEKGPIKTDRLNVRSIKIYADGALGSRGALLLEPYSDVDSNHYGLMLHTAEHIKKKAEWALENGFQVNTHCIGDSAIRTILNIYGRVLGDATDARWRIEHVQVVHPNDISKFREFAIIPSVQPTHATSDMYWAEERIGADRIKTAYALNTLKEQLGWLPLGTDFPVESISPLNTFYAATVRKDRKGWPENGFQMSDALTREDALRGITIWAALAAFEENEKGSLESGKFADFVILDRNILQVPEEDLLKSKTVATFIGGQQVY